MKKTFQTLLLGVAAIASGMGAAAAADFEPFPPIVYQDVPEIVPVEIGNGWYLRGDVGYNFDDKSGHRLDERFTTDDGFDFGIVDWEADSKWSGGLGVGYQFTDIFRADVTGEWLANADLSYDGATLCSVLVYETEEVDSPFAKAQGSCNDNLSADVDVYNYMVNAYADLGTIAGLTPYVGAGIGAANVQASFNAQTTCNPRADILIGCYETPDLILRGSALDYEHVEAESSSWNLSYALMAGAAYSINKQLKLDIGYRYLSIPEVEMFGDVDGDGVDVHQIRAGLRYSLW